MNRRIVIGETSSFRYIGIVPPIENSMAAQIEIELNVPRWFSWWYGSREQRQSDGLVYTELGFDVGDGIDTFGREVINNTTVEIAHQIADLLRSKGDDITSLDEVITIDFQTPMFGKEAEEMREFQRNINKQ